MTVRILQGHVIDKLRELPDESVHCCVTSPPYYGLRDYSIEPQVWGGDPGCEHDWGNAGKSGQRQRNGAEGGLHEGRATDKLAENITLHPSTGAFCTKCESWRGSLGLEPTLDLYLDHMVEICREIRRVLRKDGTFWLNIGDSYAGSWGAQSKREGEGLAAINLKRFGNDKSLTRNPKAWGLKPKDLMLIPSRLAIRLCDDGWWIRSDIAWCKRAPMPESCSDRPTSTWEHVFLLTKSARYFYDAEAVKEEVSGNANPRVSKAEIARVQTLRDGGASTTAEALGHLTDEMIRQNNDRYNKAVVLPVSSRNMRNFWEIDDTIDNGQSLPTRKSLHRMRAAPTQIGLFSEEERHDRESLPPMQCAKGEAMAGSEQTEASCGSEGIPEDARGEGGSREVLGITEGQGGSRQGQSGAPSAQTSNRDDANEPGMGNNKGARGASLPLLQKETEAADDRSCDPDQQRRSSRSGEHRAGVPSMQLQKTQQPNKSPLTNFWKLGPEPFPEAHFATFPTEIPRRAILAGTSERGVCPKCGAGWERQTITEYRHPEKWFGDKQGARHSRGKAGVSYDEPIGTETIGWRPTCSCDAVAAVPATVLDPFLGAGTTALVADRLGRHCIGIELNESYARMAENRIRDDAGMFAEIAAD